MEFWSYLKWKKCLKIYIEKIGSKKDNDLIIDVTQLEHSNNKWYISAFRYI